MVNLLTLVLLLVTTSVYSGKALGDYSETKTYILNPSGASSNLTGGGGGSSYYSSDPSAVYHYTPYQQQQQQYSSYGPKRPNYDYRPYDKRPSSSKSSKYDKDERHGKKPPKKRRYTDKLDSSSSDEVVKPRSGSSSKSGRSSRPSNRRNHDVDPHGRKLKNKSRSKTTTKKSKSSSKYYKKTRIDRQQDDYDDDYKEEEDYSEEEEDQDNEVDDRRPEDEDQEGTGLEPVYDYPEDVGDNDLDEGESNLDLDTTDGDPDQEETFQRPSIIDLDDGFDLAAAGLNTVMPGFGVGLKGMRRFVRPFLRPFRSRRFGPRRFFRNASRFMMIFFLLPILLLFIPIPILSSNTNASTNSRNGLATPAEQMVEVGKRVLSSEQCIERISCEINRWTSDNGRKVDQTDMFRRLMKITNQLDSFFPSFMVRMAKGYVGFEVGPAATPSVNQSSNATIAACIQFDCSKLMKTS